MAQSLLFERIRLILPHCLRMQKGHHVLVVYDETVPQKLVDTFLYAVKACGGLQYSMAYSPSRRLTVKDFGRFAGAWDLPCDPLPRVVAAAMGEADDIVMLGSDMDYFFSARLKILLRSGKKIICLPHLTNDETLIRLLPANIHEIEGLKVLTLKYFNILQAASKARITSPAGTDLHLDLGEFPANRSSGVIEEGCGFVGGLEVLPGGQVSRVPDMNSAQGTVVIDRSFAAYEFSMLKDSIVLEVKNGKIIEVKNSVEGRRFLRFLEEMGDPNLNHLTELGIGLNPQCRFTAQGGPAEDTHMAGCVSIAFGCDVHLKGLVKANAHMDATMWFPSLELNDQTIVREGALVQEIIKNADNI